METIVTTLTEQFNTIVNQISNVFAHNLPAIMSVIGMSLCLTVGIKLVKKMKGL